MYRVAVIAVLTNRSADCADDIGCMRQTPLPVLPRITLTSASPDMSNSDPDDLELRKTIRYFPATIRSKINAQNKIASPAKMPCPAAANCRASRTSSPNPFAPINEATTTIARDSRIV